MNELGQDIKNQIISKIVSALFVFVVVFVTMYFQLGNLVQANEDLKKEQQDMAEKFVQKEVLEEIIEPIKNDISDIKNSQLKSSNDLSTIKGYLEARK